MVYGGSGANDGSPANAPPKANYGGGSYVDCADPTQPGVAAVREFLDARKIPANCEAGNYYLVNNYNPGYFGDGSDAYADQNPNNTVFTVPPSTLRAIGDELSSKNISRAYFGDQFDLYLADKYGKNPRGSILQNMQLGAVRDLNHDRPQGSRRTSEGRASCKIQ